jgi:hypothetical protein
LRIHRRQRLGVADEAERRAIDRQIRLRERTQPSHVNHLLPPDRLPPRPNDRPDALRAFAELTNRTQGEALAQLFEEVAGES